MAKQGNKFIEYVRSQFLAGVPKFVENEEAKQNDPLRIEGIYQEATNYIKGLLCHHNISKQDEMIITYGITGSGKTLICQLMNSDRPPMIEKVGSKFVLTGEGVEHSLSTSGQLFPQMYPKHGKTLWVDSPGIWDTRGTDQELKQRFMMSELVGTNCKKKILLVIEDGMLTDSARGQKFIDYLKELHSIPGLLESTSLILTKSKRAADATTSEVTKELKDCLDSNGGASIISSMKNIIAQNRLVVFPEPINEMEVGKYYQGNVKQQIEQLVNNTPYFEGQSFVAPMTFSNTMNENFKTEVWDLKRSIDMYAKAIVKLIEKGSISYIKHANTKLDINDLTEALAVSDAAGQRLRLVGVEGFIDFLSGDIFQVLKTRPLMQKLQETLHAFQLLKGLEGARGNPDLFAMDGINAAFIEELASVAYKASSLQQPRPKMSLNDGELIIYGYFINANDINTVTKDRAMDIKFYTVKVFASLSINLNENVHLTSKNLVLISPKLHTNAGIRIDLSGKDGPHEATKAMDDQDGHPGLPGESGGNFLRICKTKNDIAYSFVSSGGKGGKGQDGGDASAHAAGDARDGFNLLLDHANRSGACGILRPPPGGFSVMAKQDHFKDILVDHGYRFAGLHADTMTVRDEIDRCCCCCIPKFKIKSYAIHGQGAPGAAGRDGGMGGAGGHGGYYGIIEEIDSSQALGIALASNNRQGAGRVGNSGEHGGAGQGAPGQRSGNDFDAEYKDYKLAFSWGWGCGVGALAIKLLTCFPDVTGKSRWFSWEEGRVNHDMPYGPDGRRPNQLNSHNTTVPQRSKIEDKAATIKQFNEYMQMLIHGDYQHFQEWEGELMGRCDLHNLME